MAITKCTMLFQLVTNQSGGSIGNRVAGWSESFYSANTDIAALRLDLNSLCVRRAALLPNSARIVGQRYQFIDPVGQSGQTSNQYPGTAGLNDVPQMALYFALPGVGVPNTRKTWLRGLPDARVVEGEFAISAAFTAAFNIFIGALSVWKFKAQNLSATTVPIGSVALDGTFVLQQPLTFAPNDYLTVFDSRDSAGQGYGGRFHVGTRTDAQNGKFTNWGGGARIGGRVRQDLVIYPSIDTTNTPDYKVVVRKVGRPLGGYRGRVSKRA